MTLANAVLFGVSRVGLREMEGASLSAEDSPEGLAEGVRSIVCNHRREYGVPSASECRDGEKLGQ